MAYKFVEFLTHAEDAEEQSLNWHEANKHFKTERERDAFKAAYREGINEARKLIQLHGKFKLEGV